MALQALFLTIVGAVFLYQLLKAAHTTWRLRKIPGPFYAIFSNVPRMRWILTDQAHVIHHKLHQKHGCLVRIGPDAVSVDDVDAISIIYPTKRGILKSDFYDIFQPYSVQQGAIPAIFPARDEHLHGLLKKPVAHLYSNTSAAAMEDLVDNVLMVLISALDKRFLDTAHDFDLTFWLKAFAFDAMGTLTFSKRYGFLETGIDVDSMQASIWKFMVKAAPMTQIPWLDKVIYKNVLAASIRPSTSNPILEFVGQQLFARSKSSHSNNSTAEKVEEASDMLARFLDISKQPSVPPRAVVAWTFSNVVAGSDSVAAVLNGTWHDLLNNPASLERLEQEIFAVPDLSRPCPRFQQIKDLPYLDACVWEGVRLHPAFALHLERVVPPGGFNISGQHIPAGTKVGINPYVTNRNVRAFGADASSWRPERWLSPDPDHKRDLQSRIMSFGAGRRMCMGRNIALLEMKKLIATLIVHYKLEIGESTAWEVKDRWLLRSHGLQARISKR